MSLIIALGSNQGDSLHNLKQASQLLTHHFELMAASQVYKSDPVDYLHQPSFLNQVLEFKSPAIEPREVLAITQSIEVKMGRVKLIPKGPRLIDIDIIFFDDIQFESPELTIPHASWDVRSFVLLPLLELPYAKKISLPPQNQNIQSLAAAWPLEVGP